MRPPVMGMRGLKRSSSIMTETADCATSTFRPIVVAPSYNNVGTLPDILRRITATGLPAILVNDGSTDATAEVLADWQSVDSSHRHVLTHNANCGKAAALRTAFDFAINAGFSHAITIDTDGQLAPEDFPALLDRAAREPDALVIGVRGESTADYPVRSRVGRRVSNLLVWLESGVRVADSQCGLRVYPLQLVSRLQCRAEHFGFETEIITRAGWAGVPVIGEPVSCRYLPSHERVSHFKPWLDSLRAVCMHGRLVTAALNPLSLPRRTFWHRLIHWVNPITAWRQVRGDTASRTRFAAGFAAGVFIANLPLYGVQTLLSLFVARRLRLHPLSVLAGSNVSMPPIGPLLVVAGISVGHLLLHGSWPEIADYNPTHAGFGHVLWPALWDWIIGGIVLGAVMAAVSFVGLDFLLRAAMSAGGWMSETAEPAE
jgi:glycosyltransferase involved in cell wall biosynthesis